MPFRSSGVQNGQQLVLRRLTSLALVVSLAAAGVRAQQEPEQPTPPAPARQDPEALLTRQTLRGLAESIQAKQAEIAAAREALAQAADETTRLQQAQELARLQGELDGLQRNFASIALGADVSALLTEDEKQLDISAELQRLLEPLIRELKDATEEPRQISALRSEIELHEARAQTIERGLVRLEGMRQRIPEGDALRAELDATRDRWMQRRQEERERANVAQAQLQQRLEARTSIVESTGTFLQRFFRNQGRNLLFGVLAFVAVLLGMRLLYRRFQAWVLRKRHGERPFYARLIAALYHLFTVVLAVLAVLVVFWAAGDWVLLGLSLIFLFGLAWASRQALPRYVEQVRLFLNLGPVREGERIVFDGIAYRVRSINLFARLVNDELSGGSLRVPIQDLIGQRSRPEGAREPWFPCREGDWVLLADGVRGKVVVQTPDFVQVVLLGGARQTWSTADFLAAAPRNLSGGFRVAVTFGVDYRHQAICTTEIPAKMRRKLEAGLAEMIGEENVVNVGVEFKEAGASSLDYEVLADFAGAVAQRSDALRRAIQRMLVDACNENGWVIPFTQVTLHQASG